uniref:Neur_chan_memb domain-containing protein n=1 Tax=Steinernema glaseri TaxID=37863 RepID=A0A1I7ZY28_9BILA
MIDQSCLERTSIFGLRPLTSKHSANLSGVTAYHPGGSGEQSRGYQPLVVAQQPRSSCCFRMFVRRYKERSKRIDVVSRLVFPIGYACFNVLYWAVYLM